MVLYDHRSMERRILWKDVFLPKEIEVLKTFQFSRFCGIIFIQLDSTYTGLTLV